MEARQTGVRGDRHVVVGVSAAVPAVTGTITALPILTEPGGRDSILASPYDGLTDFLGERPAVQESVFRTVRIVR